MKEMWASSVLKVTAGSTALEEEEGHVEAVGFVCCHLLLPSEFSQFESRVFFKVEGRGKVTHTPGRLCGRHCCSLVLGSDLCNSSVPRL